MALLDVRNLKKVYTTRLGSNQVQALSNVNFSVEQGEYSWNGSCVLCNICYRIRHYRKGILQDCQHR